MIKLNWKPYKKPSKQELEWIKSFGKIIKNESKFCTSAEYKVWHLF